MDKMTLPENYSFKKIFILTDGAVSNTQSVIELAKTASEKQCKLYTFGIGTDCSVDLV